MFLESEGFKEELIKAIFINIQVCKVYRSYRVCFNIFLQFLNEFIKNRYRLALKHLMV